MGLRSWRAVALLLSFGLGADALAQTKPRVIEPSAAMTMMDRETRSGPPATTSMPVGFLLNAIVTWLAANFELPAIYNHPRIAFAPPQQIASLRYGTADASGGRHVIGVYVDRSQTIYLPRGWTGRTPAELSVLVHELVHHLQNLDKRDYDCPEAREKLAYDAQEKWLGLFGRSLLQDFHLDAMTLKVVTACM